MRSWIASRTFTRLGIPTPQPIAILESKRFHCITDRALFVTSIAEGIALPEFIKKNHQDLKTMTSIAQQAQAIFSALAKHRIYHSDANAKNFIVHSNNTLSIIDLDAVEFLVPESKWHKKRQSDERQLKYLPP